METLNSKIRTTKADNQFDAQSVGVYGYNSTNDIMKRIEATDDNHLKVAVASHLVSSPDMAARTDIADENTSTFLKCDNAGILQVNDVGGGSVQYDAGDALGGTPTGTVMLAENSLQQAETLLVTGTGDLQVSDSTAHTELFAINTSCGSIDDKITTGADTTLSQAQQVLTYGEVTAGPGTGELHPLHISQAGDLQVEISGLQSTGQEAMADSLPVVIASDQSPVDSKLIGEDFAAVERNIRCDTNGKLIVQVDGVRESNSETIVIADGNTGTSSSIAMGSHKFIAFYGDTNNTTNTNIFIEYSQDQTNWYRGAGDNAKIIIVSATGNFYDEEHVTPPFVRLSRPNTSGAQETLELKYTRL